MKTLIIHPADSSTRFLGVIYKDMKNVTLLTGIDENGNCITQDQVRKMIPDYDRVIMMGHGCPDGLFSMGGFQGDRGLFIDRTFVDVLKGNPNNIYIWCNADMFVNRYQLQGFFSGMFISELGEAYYCKVKNPTHEMVKAGNYEFVKLVKQYRTRPSKVIHRNVKRRYLQLSENNGCIKYNGERLYYNE